jgi:hypothetical protein
MSRLTVFVPDLFAGLAEQSNGIADLKRWPALTLLLNRADKRPLKSTSVEEQLRLLIGADAADSNQLSVPGLTASIDYDCKLQAAMMRADPVHLRADPTQVLLFNDSSVMPSPEEADALIDVLNVGLPELGLSRGRHPARWYFSSETNADQFSNSPGTVNGRSIANFLPRDGAMHEFALLMNEAQMLLHGAPVNTDREVQGVPAINSIWIWGGDLNYGASAKAPELVVGDDVLTAGLARYFAVDWRVEIVLGEILARIKRSGGDGLVVVGSPTGAIDRDDRVLKIDDFEQRWCAPLLNALRRFQFGELLLVTDQKSFRLSPWSLLKVWRTRTPIGENRQ